MTGCLEEAIFAVALAVALIADKYGCMCYCHIILLRNRAVLIHDNGFIFLSWTEDSREVLEGMEKLLYPA